MSSTSPKKGPSDKEEERETGFLDNALRPSRWDEYVGQKSIKENLRILLSAARERKHPPEHVLFYGPPGLGKTTLAHLIAHEIGAQMKTTSGPAVEKVGDLASILTNLSPGDILFIDEIHRLNKLIEEVLYPAMESGSLDIIIGKGPSARTIQLELPPFTLLAATTRVALLSSPLRSRFSGGTFRLEYYSEKEIGEIVKRSAKILGTELDSGAIEEIAKRSRFTPRIANHLLKRCRDFAQVHKKPLNKETVKEALDLLEVDELGLTTSDRSLLSAIIGKFGGGPVGLNTLAAATGEEEATIEEVSEPYLLQLGLLERTSRGRTATPRAYEHMGVDVPADRQKNLI
ncbi:MAG: Holliday junction DNA helicase RuvB [Candidatus Lloydbacteria bacterium RIFCSPHIGHO2_01_FULL_41_20]|uniref:Holliday junction branch migration complex subunit RuvB n=1 Tax=Candidatus Lloydbacteria bacterium RIFCSPHIGHO2_01_FULL_41_20 TaxID=1798657 RepID=A0A1G2CTV1_9BACT|nr:MAG: Holliday junction DNA helicase RuvB [Candidatus Lloydbacteria bacterium RIFCSPHIGHO2_01_FULL_41_20]